MPSQRSETSSSRESKSSEIKDIDLQGQGSGKVQLEGLRRSRQIRHRGCTFCSDDAVLAFGAERQEGNGIVAN